MCNFFVNMYLKSRTIRIHTISQHRWDCFRIRETTTITWMTPRTQGWLSDVTYIFVNCHQHFASANCTSILSERWLYLCTKEICYFKQCDVNVLINFQQTDWCPRNIWMWHSRGRGNTNKTYAITPQRCFGN